MRRHLEARAAQDIALCKKIYYGMGYALDRISNFYYVGKHLETAGPEEIAQKSALLQEALGYHFYFPQKRELLSRVTHDELIADLDAKMLRSLQDLNAPRSERSLPFKKTYRSVDPEKGAQLLDALTDPSAKIVFSRHGIQVLNPLAQQASGSERKMVMMFEGPNRTDPITLDSFIEAAGVAVYYAAAERKTGRIFRISSSLNRRALLVAAIFGAAIARDPIMWDPRLDCLNYPSLPSEELNEMLGVQNNGSLPWMMDNVDLIGGKGTYGRIITDVKELIEEGFQTEGVQIYITHTQQTNALDLQHCGEAPSRWAELGCRVLFSDGRSLLMDKGILQDPLSTTKRLLEVVL